MSFEGFGGFFARFGRVELGGIWGGRGCGFGDGGGVFYGHFGRIEAQVPEG